MGCPKITYHYQEGSIKNLRVFSRGVEKNEERLKKSVSTYRYGFQGQEKDDEIKGEGNSVNYKYRMHDPRIGRFFSIDPLAPKYPYWTPYQFAGNMVIQYVELEGLEPSMTPEAIERAYGNRKGSPLDQIQNMLEEVGFVPVLGEPADALNGIIYAARGKYAEAGLSFISIVPVVGDGIGKGSKFILRHADDIKGLTKSTSIEFKTAKSAERWVENATKYSPKIADALHSPRKSLQKALGSKGTGKAAHHLVPVDLLKNNKFVQQAVEEGFDFNGKINGLALSASQHSGRHPNSYLEGITNLINTAREYRPNSTAKDVLESVSGHLKKILESNPDIKVNDLFK